MKDTIIAIVISIIASFIYDKIKSIYSNYSKTKNSFSKPQRCSPKYLKSVKKEFFVAFSFGILFSVIPQTKYEFVNIAIDISTFFSFFVTLMAFMCMEEIVNSFSDKNPDKD